MLPIPFDMCLSSSLFLASSSSVTPCTLPCEPPALASPPRPSLSPLPGLQHPTRKLQFLLASKSRSDVQAIGGNWEPVDGGHPERDPQALVRTAVRTFKEATGLDISDCSQVWRWGMFCVCQVADTRR